MQFQYTPYALPLIIAAVIAAWVAFYALRYRGAHGAVALSVLSLAIAEWSFMYGMELLGADLATKFLFGKAQYFGIIVTPLAWMIFTYNHANPGKQIDYRIMAGLAVVATLTFGLTITTEYHGLMWNNIDVDYGKDFSVLGITHGNWFWFVHMPYAYGLLLAGTWFMLRSIIRTRGSYRGQATALIIAVVVPWIGNILYLVDAFPIPLFDPTPFAFTVSIIATAWGIFGFQLLALSPVARDNIIDDMEDGVIVIDINDQVADINPAALKLIGMAGQNIIGVSAFEALKAWPDLIEKYRNVIEASDDVVFGKGENRKWYELQISLLHQNKRRIGRVITIHNITAIKQAEELKNAFLEDMRALQEINLILSEEENLNALYIKMITMSRQRLGIDRMGLFLHDKKTNQLQGTYGVDEDGNSRNESYYREEITPDHWTLEILDSLNHAKLWQNAPILDNNIIIGAGWKAGATLWDGHHAIGYLICDNFLTEKPARPYELELISLLGNTFGHLIQRKQNEAILQESETRYRQIVENASDIIYRTNNEGHFTYINPIGLHLMHFSSENDLLGKHYTEVISQSFRHKVKRFYDRQYIAKELNTYQEFPVITALGTELWLGQNVQLTIEGGMITGFQALARDITDLVKTKDALALARDQALEASQLKSQLLAKVSHELRTPLGGVLGYAELLKYGAFGPLEEKQLNAASQIIESAHYLTTMVNELLDQAQAESKSIILHISDFNIHRMLEHVEANANILASKKGLTLRKTIDPNVPETLQGDRQRLQQILINLAGNAIKFTKTGEVHIQITRPDETHWAMQVSDTGAGIPKEAQEYIFEPFRQVNNAITRENRGTGLGLSITKQLVDLMGGEITVESEIDKGSTFTILLPILKETEKNI